VAAFAASIEAAKGRTHDLSPLSDAQLKSAILLLHTDEEGALSVEGARPRARRRCR
jgi:hypothetical protein